MPCKLPRDFWQVFELVVENALRSRPTPQLPVRVGCPGAIAVRGPARCKPRHHRQGSVFAQLRRARVPNRVPRSPSKSVGDVPFPAATDGSDASPRPLRCGSKQRFEFETYAARLHGASACRAERRAPSKWKPNQKCRKVHLIHC